LTATAKTNLSKRKSRHKIIIEGEEDRKSRDAPITEVPCSSFQFKSQSNSKEIFLQKRMTIVKNILALLVLFSMNILYVFCC
jgi:hypothetical protein